MFSKIVIKDSSPIGVKKAQKIVNRASGFESNMKLIYEDKEVDLKSILGIMSLAILDGAEITIQAYGEDANDAIAEINKILNEK